MRMTVPKRLPTSAALSETASGGTPPHGREDVLQALTDALRGLAPEDLRDSHVGLREAHRGVLSAGDGAPHPEVGPPGARLALAGRPLELEGPHILR